MGIEVRDDGCGMDARTLEQVFDPFFTTKPPGQGTGLGLAVVQAIVGAHGAALEVESAHQRGPTFRLVWPAAGAARREALAPASAVSGAGVTVLLAEDDASVRRLARLTLERRGYHVLEAEDGEAAVALFERHREDVALAVLDLSMPRRDGLCALRALRALAPALPAVVMSGRIEPLLDEAARPPGVGVLAEPFGPEELAERVRSALADGRQEASGEGTASASCATQASAGVPAHREGGERRARRRPDRLPQPLPHRCVDDSASTPPV